MVYPRAMLKLDVSVDAQGLARQLGALVGTQVPFATALALTKSAQAGQHAEEAAIGMVFDRPTSYARGGVRIEPATKAKLWASVKLKDDANKGVPAAKFLNAEVYGGERSLKGSERALRSAGILPDGMMAVPGSAAKIDSYGNMDRGQLMQILSYLKAQSTGGYTRAISKGRAAKLKREGISYLVGRIGRNGPMGIYERRGFAHGVSRRPLLIFVKAPRYSVRLPFHKIATNAATAAFPAEFERAMDFALRTAR